MPPLASDLVAVCLDQLSGVRDGPPLQRRIPGTLRCKLWLTVTIAKRVHFIARLQDLSAVYQVLVQVGWAIPHSCGSVSLKLSYQSVVRLSSDSDWYAAVRMRQQTGIGPTSVLRIQGKFPKARYFSVRQDSRVLLELVFIGRP